MGERMTVERERAARLYADGVDGGSLRRIGREHVAALLAELDAVRAERDEAAETVAGIVAAMASGEALAETMPPLDALPVEARGYASIAIGSAAWVMKQQIEANPDPEVRSSLTVTIVYGEDDAWHLRMARESTDRSFGLLMMRERQEARKERDAANARAEAAERSRAAVAADRAERHAADERRLDALRESLHASEVAREKAEADLDAMRRGYETVRADRDYHCDRAIAAEAALAALREKSGAVIGLAVVPVTYRGNAALREWHDVMRDNAAAAEAWTRETRARGHEQGLRRARDELAKQILSDYDASAKVHELVRATVRFLNRHADEGAAAIRKGRE